ncbi:MAG: serine/threonine-protein kinase [Kofleriaceae bacterium]
MDESDAAVAPTLVRDIGAWLADNPLDTAGATLATIVPATVGRPSGGPDLARLLGELTGAGPEALRAGETLGEGGMGVVRTAEQVALGRQVAVKSLKPGRRDAAGALDLMREAWITGALEHPNIVPVHTLGLDEAGYPMIVLKRIEGVAWSDLLDEPAAVTARFGAVDPLAWHLETLVAVLNALRFAHSRGIIHRDLKPANVMIGHFGEVYLLDWGLAVTLHDDPTGRLPRAADATDLAGTPCYMAPEMLGLEHGGPLSERTDVYLAGAMLFELCTGQPPHVGATPTAMIASVLHSQPELPAAVPTELARICRRAMARDQAARYSSIAALQRDLRDYLHRRGAVHLIAVAEGRLGELVAEAAALDRPVEARRERIHRLLGACRFGFVEAQVAWPDHPSASDGIVRATAAAAEFELVAGDPRAALKLLAELDAPPPALMARVRDAAAADERRLAELEALGRQHDRGVGTRTRVSLATMLGLVFTGLTLVAAIEPAWLPRRTYPRTVGYSVGLLVLVLGLIVWARESLRKTVVNRRAAAITAMLFVEQTALVATCWRFGVPLATAEVLMMFLWFVNVGAIVVGIDGGLWPTLLGNAAGLALAVAWPAHRFVFASVVNLGFTANALWLWWPRPPGRGAVTASAPASSRSS